MKRALLVGVPDVGKPNGLRPAPGLAAMTALLEDLGGWQITTLAGRSTHREQVLAALDAMLAACEPHDTCLFYFFGHGGVVRFSPLPGTLGERPVFYLATRRPPGASMVGVLDDELSDVLTRLDQICGNVTAILDCCHSATIVRTAEIPVIAPPSWVTEHTRRVPERPRILAVESHPRIVRLAGASSLREAYAVGRADGHCGLLTRNLVEVLREADLRCDRLSWDTVAHRVREQACLARHTEEQRVVLAGPRQRLVFSRVTVALPRSAAYVPSGERGWGWLRAGLLQGVEVGDRWVITELSLGDDLEPRTILEAEVRRVELDRCEVALSASPPRELPAGSSALLESLGRRLPVAVEASPSVVQAIEFSGLLRIVEPNTPTVVARVRERVDSTLDVTDDEGRPLWPNVPREEPHLRAVLELLEDRATTQRFLASLVTNDSSARTATTLYWRWGRIGPHEEPIELTAAHGDRDGTPVLHVGDRIWIELGHRGHPPPHWFVSVVQVEIEGRLALLNTREPEGMEVAPGVPVHVGLRGSRRRQGLTLVWPPRVPMHDRRSSTLIVLASMRPFSLGRLARSPSPDDDAMLIQGLGVQVHAPVRGAATRPPMVSPAWTWGRIDFELDPHPRQTDPREPTA